MHEDVPTIILKLYLPMHRDLEIKIVLRNTNNRYLCAKTNENK